MKITKRTYPEQLEQRKLAANVGCDVCPCCGETKTTLYYITTKPAFASTKGIVENFRLEYGRAPLFSRRVPVYRIDTYYCFSCGCRWESEKYLIEEIEQQ